MPIQVNGLSKQFRLFKREAGLSGALRSFFNRKYENFHALTDISLKIEDGEILGILGENGAGKTTLLSMVTGDSTKGYGKELYLFGKKKGPKFAALLLVTCFLFVPSKFIVHSCNAIGLIEFSASKTL